MYSYFNSQSLSILKDFILIVTAIIGSTVAIKGLGTWKKSLKGGVEYDLTRRLMKSTYKLREAINGVRNSLIWSYEMPEPDKNTLSEMSESEIRHYGLACAYEKRWESVIQVVNEFRPDLLEAETLWGKEVHQQFDRMFKLQTELFINVRNYLDVMNPKLDEPSKDAIQKLMRKKRDVLYRVEKDDEDADLFHNDLLKAIQDIETYLKPHLKK